MSSLLMPAIAQNVFSAGGLDPSRFDWKEVWYPVYYVDDLDKTKLTSFTLLEQDIVIWWDQTQATWRAFVDQCPHRLAPLSQGRINESGLLECPYHGWTFSGQGTCESIPQQAQGGQAEVSRRACVQSFPTQVRQGLLFVFPGTAENAEKTPIPIVDPLEESAKDWVCLNIFRDLPYDALTLLENVLDSSHIPYTHHQTVGDRANVSPVNLAVVHSDRQGFQGVWEEGPRKGTLGRQTTTFIAPGLMWHDLTSQQYGRTLTVVYATPIRKGECRLFARFPFKFSSKIPRLAIQLTPAWFSHLGQHRVLEDDQIFLHYQERYLEQKGGSEKFAQAFYLPTKADLFVAELRQWVNQYQAESFPGQRFSPALPTEILLDRYYSHTQNCVSCRTALANIQRIKKGTAIVAAIALSLTPILLFSLGQNLVLGISLTGLLLISGILWLSLQKLEKRFYQGEPIPPRNLPNKKAQK
ncbi:MAG: Rieske 2Fe-2S domain-containing protein [Snowella sp.]|nr:Rieske 2Fe-2S domain-containing protein [Snowella sp.]